MQANHAVPRSAEPAGGRAPHHRDELDFQHLLDAAAWWRLAPDVRRRFSRKPEPEAPIRYTGVMRLVACSRAGWLLAQLCRAMGTPFAPHRGREVPVDIVLQHSPCGGVIWERVYRYAGRAPVRVSSTKRIGDDGSLLECVGFGFGMRLAVFEAGQALHFLSLRYFWRVGGRMLWLPHLLSPGTAHVVHQDLGQGRFRFTMSFHHALFGSLFEQDGVFHADEGAVQ